MILASLFFALQAPAGGDTITLAEALARAREARAALTIAGSLVAEARAAVRTASAIPNPIVSYSHSGAVPTNHFLVDQPLDWVLRRGSDRAAAQAGVRRAQADSNQTMIGLARDVRLAFWRARAAQLSQSLVEAQAREADSLAAIATARLRAGDISLLEQEQAALEAARARQAVSTAREGARVVLADLARALGLATLPRPVDPLDSGLDQLPDTAIDPSTIPAVRAAVADSEATAALARSASRARLPFPAIQSGAEWGDSAQPGTLAVVGLAIPLPLWQRGGGPLAEARARAIRASALAREARLDAIRDLRQARIRLEEAAVRARVARDSLIPSAGVLRVRALQGYQAGETGIVPVLDAFRSERDVVLGALQDQLAYQEALADWYALAGRTE